MKFRKKPVEFEAMRFEGCSFDGIKWEGGEICRWLESNNIDFKLLGNESQIKINTLRRIITVELGDWIIKDASGNFSSCKPDIFEKTYEAI